MTLLSQPELGSSYAGEHLAKARCFLNFKGRYAESCSAIPRTTPTLILRMGRLKLTGPNPSRLKGMPRNNWLGNANIHQGQVAASDGCFATILA
jgi:hypothetical protein